MTETEPLRGTTRGRPADAPATSGTGSTPTRFRARRRDVVTRLVLVVLTVVGALIAARSGFGLLWFVPYASVGILLIVRRPGMPIGWLLFAIGWLLVAQVMPVDATPEQFATGTVPWPQLVLSYLAGGPLGVGAMILFAYLAMVFPSGHLPDGRWGRVGRMLLTTVAALVVLTGVGPTINVNLIGAPNGANVRNPLALAPDAEIWRVLDPQLVFSLVIALLLGGAVALVIRHGHARGVERQQLTWVVAAIAFVAVAIIGGLVAGSIVPEALDDGIVWIPSIAAFAIVPVSVGIAVLRYRLYEIDRIVSRTIGWATTSAVLVAVFVAVVLVTQTALSSITSSNTLAVAVSTLAVAALFQPLRRRVQRRVDKRFNRAHYDAERTVAAFSDRLREEVNLDQLSAETAATVARTVQPASVLLWLRAWDKVAPRA